MKRGTLVPALTFGLFSLPTTAAACINCMIGMFEYALPYTLVWCLGIAVWFCAVRAVVGRPFTAVLWVFLTFIVAAAGLGPVAFILLGGMAFGTTVNAYSPDVQRKLPKGSRIGLTLVSVAAFICISAGFAISMHTKSTCSDADFILSGYESSTVLQRLIAEPEKNAEQLRKIMAQTDNEYIVEEIARTLAKPEQEGAKSSANSPNSQIDQPEQHEEQSGKALR